MEPPKQDKTLEIAQRTRKNLEFIYAAKEQGKDVEEFTQLLNSMLGMVISLREDYFKKSEITWTDVMEMSLESWGQRLQIEGNLPTYASPKLKPVGTFSGLMTRLRNAFAHSCFDLVIGYDENDKAKIIGVTVWNIPPKADYIHENRVWEAEIMEEELKGLAYLFVEYLEKKPIR